MITTTKNPDGSITVTLTNGDVSAYESILATWPLRQDTVFKFAIGAMLKATNQRLYVDVDTQGTKGVLVIPEDLKKDAVNANTTTTTPPVS